MKYVVTTGTVCGKNIRKYYFDKYIDACLFLVNDANETYHGEALADGNENVFIRFKKYNYAVVYNNARNAVWFWEIEREE